MIGFFLTAGALVALALAFVLPPLVRRDAAPAGLPPSSGRGPAWAVGLGVPLGAAVLYAALGTPQALIGPAAVPDVPVAEAGAPGSAGIGPAQIEAMVARLASRLEKEPDDVDGWRMLAHSYETLRRFDAAVNAYRRLIALEPNNADVLTDCAVALAMSLNQALTGEPEKLIDRALAINPNHVQALALKGSAAYEHGDYARAIGPWKKILSMVPPESDMAKSIAAGVEKAEALAKQK